jgi:RNA polymerase sigma factor (sigma-70 family)
MLDALVPSPLLTRRAPESSPSTTAVNPGGRVLLERHYDLICRKLDRLGRQSGLPEHDAEELRSWALFRLVEDDYRILASWTGRSSFATYLTVVLVNLARDYRTHLWGKWRPSAEAQRSGPAGVMLERLWVRDGLTLDEAIARIRVELPDPPSRARLEEIAARLPRRVGRRRVGDEELCRIAVDGQAEARVETREQAGPAARVREILRGLLRELAAEDRLLLRLHFRDGLSLAAVAPLFGTPQRLLYRRRNRCLLALRQGLERAGIRGFPNVEIDDPSLWA